MVRVKLEKFAVEKFGHIDYLINNAGVISWESFENEKFDEKLSFLEF